MTRDKKHRDKGEKSDTAIKLCMRIMCFVLRRPTITLHNCCWFICLMVAFYFLQKRYEKPFEEQTKRNIRHFGHFFVLCTLWSMSCNEMGINARCGRKKWSDSFITIQLEFPNDFILRWNSRHFRFMAAIWMMSFLIMHSISLLIKLCSAWQLKGLKMRRLSQFSLGSGL